jgi:preprotein translocase subunit SecF
VNVRLLRIVPDDTKIPFMRLRVVSFPLSALLATISMLLFFTIGLNYGIDFRGGTLIEVQSKAGPANLAAMRSTLGQLNVGVQLQQFGPATDVLVRIEQQPGGDVAQQRIVERAKGALGDTFEIRRVEVVGPTVSRELLQGGIIGSVVSLLGILVYLWFRFEWQFALAAIIATMHDVTLTIGFYAVTRLEFDLSALAVILTILGYSLNDTVILFDRIREMLRRYKRISTAELLDNAMNVTLPRTVITASTSFLALLGLYFFGGELIRGFTSAMLFGIVVGTYSTACIAAPMLIYFGVKTSSVAEGAATVPARA